MLVDDRPVRRWVWVVPAVFADRHRAAIDYGDLADKGIGFVALLLLAALCVGFGEEGMFRGIGSSRSVSTASARAGSRCGRASCSAPCT